MKVDFISWISNFQSKRNYCDCPCGRDVELELAISDTTMARRGLSVVLALCLLTQGLCYPHRRLRKRATEDGGEPTDSAITNTPTESTPCTVKSVAENEIIPPAPCDNNNVSSSDDDDDDDGFESMETSSTGDGGGSNIFTLLRIAGAILPSFSNANVQSDGEASSPLFTLKLDILRALVQFGTSMLGLASSTVFSTSG